MFSAAVFHAAHASCQWAVAKHGHITPFDTLEQGDVPPLPGGADSDVSDPRAKHRVPLEEAIRVQREPGGARKQN